MKVDKIYPSERNDSEQYAIEEGGYHLVEKDEFGHHWTTDGEGSYLRYLRYEECDNEAWRTVGPSLVITSRAWLCADAKHGSYPFYNGQDLNVSIKIERLCPSTGQSKYSIKMMTEGCSEGESKFREQLDRMTAWLISCATFEFKGSFDDKLRDEFAPRMVGKNSK